MGTQVRGRRVVGAARTYAIGSVPWGGEGGHGGLESDATPPPPDGMAHMIGMSLEGIRGGGRLLLKPRGGREGPAYTNGLCLPPTEWPT